MANTAPRLMTEEDVRHYFIQNGGIVRNTDIVTYFRAYLSNPSVREEARVLFKTYVNKLATVKVENGEKFLVLKRQYFPPIDGNGKPTNNSYGSAAAYSQMSGLPNPYNGPPSYAHPPSSMSTSNINNNSIPNNHYLQRQTSQPSQYGSHFSLSSNYGDPYGSQMGLTSSDYNQNTNLHYPNSANYSHSHAPNMHGQHALNLQQQQSQHYQQYPQGLPSRYPSHSQVSVNSYQPGPAPTPTSDFIPDYGLPPMPMTMSPPRRFVSPPNSSGYLNSIAGMSASRLPPPYRPPPPAPHLTSPTSSVSSVPFSSPPSQFSSPPSSISMSMPNSRRNSVGSGINGGLGQAPYRGGPPGYYPSTSMQSVNSNSEPTSPPNNFQYQRSISVSGQLDSQAASFDDHTANKSYFDTASNFIPAGQFIQGGAPPPPVPPRSKRGVERSPSAVGPTPVIIRSTSNHRRTVDEMDMMTMNYNSGIESIGAAPGTEVRPQNTRVRENGLQAKIDNCQGETGDNEKENVQLRNSEMKEGASQISVPNNVNGLSETEKISVKERAQKFNRVASESEILSPRMPSVRNRREAAKHDSCADFDTASLSSYSYGFSNVQLEPKAKEWMLKAAECDYHVLNKMAQETPYLVKRKDMNYTALHWAAKHGHLDLVKLLAGTFKSDVNVKSNGGYTPLHLAAQFGRQEVYDILRNVYFADASIRDHSGKKPMQYMARQDTTVSMDTFKKIKEKRRSTEAQRERDSNSFLRIGSLNVRVKKTTEAFNNFIGKSNSSSNFERVMNNMQKWGSADDLQDSENKSESRNNKDKQLMPPPVTTAVLRATSKQSKKSKIRRSIPDSQSIKENNSDSESDTACGFGSDWQNNPT